MAARVRPNFGANVPGTGEQMVRPRTSRPPVPGTWVNPPLLLDAPGGEEGVFGALNLIV